MLNGHLVSKKSMACSFIMYFNFTDVQPPSLTCPEDIVSLIGLRQDCAMAIWEVPAATDNSMDNLIIRSSPPSGTCFSQEVTTVEVTASDLSGNVNRCTFTVTVMMEGIFYLLFFYLFITFVQFLNVVLKHGSVYARPISWDRQFFQMWSERQEDVCVLHFIIFACGLSSLYDSVRAAFVCRQNSILHHI